jgi:hypothetical protein
MSLKTAALLVEPARDVDRFRVDRDDRVQLRPVLVVRFDALQIELHELFVRQLAGVDRRLNVGDARRQEIERSRRLRGRDDKRGDRQAQCAPEASHGHTPDPRMRAIIAETV